MEPGRIGADIIGTVRLGTLEVSRLVIGGNPFSGFSHQSDERDAEMRAFYTDGRIVDTLFEAESLGLRTLILRGDEHIARCLGDYWRRGGTMQWVAQTDSRAETQEDGVRFCVAHGASACFLHGGITDNYVAQGRTADLSRAVELIRSLGLPCGVAGHDLDALRWAEAHLDVDFYMACYYNPSPRKGSPHHVPGSGERYTPQDRVERQALVATLSRPAIHYKVLAAGRLPAEDALRDAAHHMRPQDAVCVGIYTGDNRQMIREDIAILADALSPG